MQIIRAVEPTATAAISVRTAFSAQSTNLMLEGSVEALLILAVVVGVVVGVGFTTWQLASQDTGRFAWLLDAATDLPELEKNLNHLSEQGFGVHRILSPPLGTEPIDLPDRRPSINMRRGRGRQLGS